MADFLEDLRKVKTENENKNENVISEILKYFKEQLDSENFEIGLKDRLTKAIRNNEKEYDTWVEFWDYHSGCSDTHFSVPVCKVWYSDKTGYDSKYYKNVTLYDIHKKVIDNLLRMYVDKLCDLGLKVMCVDDTGKIGYKKWKVIISLDF